MSIAWPGGASASSRWRAPPVSSSVGAPEAALTTPMSFMNTPLLKPVPTALEKASLAAKRLARVPARLCGREAALARSVAVNPGSRNLSPTRSSARSIRSMLHRSEPMPTIIGQPFSSGRVHQLPHPADARLETGEDRLADEEMADVELGELRDGGDRDDVVEGEAMAGVGLDPVLGGKRGAVGDALKLPCALL